MHTSKQENNYVHITTHSHVYTHAKTKTRKYRRRLDANTSKTKTHRNYTKH